VTTSFNHTLAVRRGSPDPAESPDPAVVGSPSQEWEILSVDGGARSGDRRTAGLAATDLLKSHYHANHPDQSDLLS
jgi:hypothetical protein